MDKIDELLLKIAEAYGTPFLAGVGVISLWVWRKRLCGVLLGSGGASAGGKETVRRREDELMRLFLEAFQKSAQAQQQIADALEQNGGRLDTLSKRLDDVAMRLDEFTREIHQALRDIHSRIDDLYRRDPSGR